MEEESKGVYFEQVVKDAIKELHHGSPAYCFNLEQLKEIIKHFKNTSYTVDNGVYRIVNNDVKKVEKRGRKGMTRVILYQDKNDETEIAIKASLQECINWGGLGSCDLCGYNDEELYLCPELGEKGLCKSCFDKHKRNVQWYVEDTHIVFDTLIVMCAFYKLKFTDYEYKMINKFFDAHGHSRLDMRKLVKIAKEANHIESEEE